MKEKLATLQRTKQCSNCPWKVSCDLSKIPNYSKEYHEKLKTTIAKSVWESLADMEKGRIHVFCCHESTGKLGRKGEMCIGWLFNQLNQGNNIALRLDIQRYSNSSEIEIFGEQWNSFEETFQNDHKH
jgi:hypothetical protein